MEGLTDKVISIEREEKEVVSYKDIDREKELVELQLKKEFLDSAKQDREERKKFADKIFTLLTCFLSGTILIVICAGLSKCISFELSDTILIALLTTTTANVIGIFLFVVKYIFKANICHRCGGSIIDNN